MFLMSFVACDVSFAAGSFGVVLSAAGDGCVRISPVIARTYRQWLGTRVILSSHCCERPLLFPVRETPMLSGMKPPDSPALNHIISVPFFYESIS